MSKITKEQAFLAAFELKAVIITKQKALATALRVYPADRMPADVRSNTAKWASDIELLTPVLAYLEEKAGRAAPTL
jgi:hypothetical protein